jgi:hypothetical protein
VGSGEGRISPSDLLLPSMGSGANFLHGPKCSPGGFVPPGECLNETLNVTLNVTTYFYFIFSLVVKNGLPTIVLDVCPRATVQIWFSSHAFKNG